MNKIQKRRLYLVITFMFGICIAAGLVLYALRQNINVFLTPAQIAQQHFPNNYPFRLGGLVKRGSLHHDQGLGVTFIVTDFKKDLPVSYDGVLPDLFREGKGVVAEGSINQHGIFIATQVLAKHDENYVPREVTANLGIANNN